MSDRRLQDWELRDVIARLRDPKCTACDGRKMVTAPFTRGMIDCATCEGTGFFSLSTEVTLAAFEELLTVRDKMLTPEEGSALEKLAERMRPKVNAEMCAPFEKHALSAIDKLLRIERKEST